MLKPAENLDSRKIEHRFDWYQASVPAAPALLLSKIVDSMPFETITVPGPGLHSFKVRNDVADAETGEVLATVMHGGVNPLPNAKASGGNAPALADLLRSCWPDHRVSRLDVAVDYQGKDAFEQSIGVMSKVARKYRVKGEKILPDDLDDGATYYLGARSSFLRLRCYEKGKELYKRTGDTLWRDFFGWARLELQVRPQKDFKSAAARMKPVDFWGCATWAQEIAKGVLEFEPEPVDVTPTVIADHERALRFMVKQYGPTMLRQLARLGSPAAFMDDLLNRLGLDDEKLREIAEAHQARGVGGGNPPRKPNPREVRDQLFPRSQG